MGTGDQATTAPTPGIEDLPELHLLFQNVFVAPDAFVSMNPLDEEGRGYWADIVAAYGKRRFDKARELAVTFAQWLDDTYQRRERLQFDDTTFSILLDGELYSRLRPEGYALLKLLAVHKTDGGYVNADEIIAAFNDLAADKSTGLTGAKCWPRSRPAFNDLAADKSTGLACVRNFP